MKPSILADFDCVDHNQSTTTPVGDRQSRVGITENATIVANALDLCLLNDNEWDLYCSRRNDESTLLFTTQ
jgi:hypothetical protein